MQTYHPSSTPQEEIPSQRLRFHFLSEPCLLFLLEWLIDLVGFLSNQSFDASEVHTSVSSKPAYGVVKTFWK